MAKRGLSFAVALALATAALLALEPACVDRYEADSTAAANRCSSCHGDATRSGTLLQRAAPPIDLYGNTKSEYPGVGAHLIHLYAGATHGAVACNECHVVPEDVESPGHNDTKGPAKIVFGSLATRGGLTPHYNQAAETCTSTYCHRDAHPVWTHPRSETDACGTCHSIPPPPPHVQVPTQDCGTCHSAVIDRNLHFIAPEKHVDGIIEVHSVGCNACHGSDRNNAPPNDLDGNTATTAPGVGAHQAHLAGGANSRPLACNECHVVPTKVTDPGHTGPPPAKLTFSGVAASNGRTPTFDLVELTCSNWCHSPDKPGGYSPVWTRQGGRLPCNGCHGLPPAPPHPQVDNCHKCHSAVVAADNRTIINRSLHVDGKVEVASLQCNSCHGSDKNNAPPVDVEGDTSTTAPGVGAHQIHLMGSSFAAPVACNACHVVPTTLTSPGHVDHPLPAIVTFSGVATAFGAQPTFVNGTCKNTFCHGDSFVGGHDSGGTLREPVWTKVDGTQDACGTCHGLPPPPPHPTNADDCSTCHHDIDANRNFIHPEEHVDGKVTF
jgi:predicted CxxxxCH...CXXCH cytochrome family protein